LAVVIPLARISTDPSPPEAPCTVVVAGAATFPAASAQECVVLCPATVDRYYRLLSRRNLPERSAMAARPDGWTINDVLLVVDV
jgi:hypothetical protein